MNTALIFFLQGGGGPNLLVTLLPFIVIFIIYQFLIAKPQKQRQQALEEMLKNLKAGDKIITTGGIYGTVTEVNDKEGVVQVRIAESVKINVARNAIASLQEPKKETAKESEKK
jgi:preprotein translocase subunit YajC